ncbi:MAG: pyrroline-5-carboxylate reductase [Gammaproteobacteria bacterium]|nr:MAG: pyrroline-5-carboxylate reductase [Gammaproteobacteria bacterium]
MNTANTYRYAFIGAGNMSKGIMGGMIHAGIAPSSIITSTRTAESGQQLIAEFGVHNSQNNDDCLDADTVVLAVKPQILPEVLAELDSARLRDKLIVSVIAGVPCATYRRLIGENIRLVRTMPNMPAKIGRGMTGLYAENCSASDKQQAEQLMRYAGDVLWVESEAGINQVNAISGSGPAYVYAFIDHLASAGEKLGLSYQDALHLAVQTLLGSAALVEQSGARSHEDLQALIGQITSKGGTTHQAIQSFADDGFKQVVDNAVQRCHQRALELGKAE